MATVKTIRLEVAYQNEWGKILWNRNWRIFTIEVDGETIEEKAKNFHHLMIEFHKELKILQDVITSSNFSNDQAKKDFDSHMELQIFMENHKNGLIMDQGPYDSNKELMNYVLESGIKEMMEQNPELKEIIPPHLRHRFE